MKISNLHELFLHELQDLYSAETQIIEALPKMIRETSDEKLRLALQKHLDVTKDQLERLETINENMNFKKESHVCEGMKGIIAEAEKGLKNITDPATKDAAIIASAQRVEHYEIAGYGTAAQFADEMSHEQEARLLKETLGEEKQADDELSTLATGGLFSEGINQDAMQDEMED